MSSLCQQKELNCIPTYSHGTLTPFIGVYGRGEGVGRDRGEGEAMDRGGRGRERGRGDEESGRAEGDGGVLK